MFNNEEETNEKITIIEGPSPTFELIPGGWVTGIIESPNLANIAVTRLRTFKGAELVERCHRAWRNKETINLEYRSLDGLNAEVPIIAARYTESTDGQTLFLWVRLQEDEFEFEFDYYDDYDELDDFDDEDDFDEDIGFDLKF